MIKFCMALSEQRNRIAEIGGKTLEIAKEEQITLIINEEPYHIMCTPEYLKELVLGFLISEGFATSLNEIEFDSST